MSCGPTIGVCTPGPQGPQGPTGPTGPSAGGGNNVSIIGNVAGAPALISSGTLYLAGGNNVTLSQNGQSITISGGSAAAGGISASMGGNTAGVLALISTGTLLLAGGNNVTLSQNGNSVTISANTAAAANLSVSAGSTSSNYGGLTFANGSNVSFGLNNGTITASVVAQTTQTQPAGSIAGIGVTTTTQAGSTMGATLSTNGLSLAMPPWLTAAATHDVTLSGNTSGTPALISSGTLTLAGGNNITLSQVGNAITISGANAGGAQTGISGIQVSNTTYTSGTVLWQNANGITFGSSGANGVSASYNSTQFAGTGTSFSGTNISGSMTLNSNGLNLALSGAAGTAATTGGVYAAGNTTGQSSSSTYALSALNLSLAGVLSGGWSSNSFIISSPGTTGLTQLSAGISTGGNTSGNTGLASAQLVLAGGNNITLSGSTNGGSMTVTISGGTAAGGGFNIDISGNTTGTTAQISTGTLTLAGGNNITLSQSGNAITISGANVISTGGLYALGNTTQNSSTTLNLSALSFDALGAMTWGYSNGSIQVSAPATSSISGTGLVSVSVNGSTISIGAAQPQLSLFQAIPPANTSITQIGQGSVVVYPVFQPEAFTATRADVFASISGSSSSNSSYAGVVSVYMGAYTRNGSTLSLASSGSQSYQFTNTSNNSFGSITGLRRLSVPFNVNYSGNQDLYVGMMSLTSSTNAAWFTASNVVVPWANTAQLQGLIGEASNNSKQYVPGMGIFSATSGGMPASIGLSQISGLGSTGQYLPPVNFANFTA